MPNIEQYNQWKKDNPQSSIIDFCDGRCDLRKITDIITFSKIVSSDKLTPEIEAKIRNEISRCFSEIIKEKDFGLEDHFRSEIEDILEFELNFEFDGYNFEYDFSYNLGIEIDDDQFNEYINFKIANIPNYNSNCLDSQKNRVRLLHVTQESPIFLTALAKAIQNYDNNESISFNYGGFDFKYDNLESLPKVVFDEQIQNYIEEKYGEITNLSEIQFIQKMEDYYKRQIKNNFEDEFNKGLPVELNNSNLSQYSEYIDSHNSRFKKFVADNRDDIMSNLGFYKQLENVALNDLDEFEYNITPENIYKYMSVFIDLNKMFEAYDEQHSIQISSDLVDGFYDAMTSVYRRIIDGVVERFDYSVIDDVVIPDQLDNALDLCAIDDYFDNLHLTIDEAMDDFYLNRQSVLEQIVSSFEERIKSWGLVDTIVKCNSEKIYQSIKNEILNDGDYPRAYDNFSEALTNNDLLKQHRIIAAVMHVINSKHANKTIINDARKEHKDESLSSALRKVEHYHKTFVLGNDIDLLKYSSKHKEKVIEKNISQILERLQFTGRYINRQQQIAKIENKVRDNEENIARWQKKISDNNDKIKQLLEDGNKSEKKRKNEEGKLVKNNVDTELQTMKAEEQVTRLKDDIDQLEKTVIPKKGDKNILVPTFIFTVGYKDEEGKTSKRNFIEVPISDGSLKIINLEDLDKDRVQSLVKKTDDSFRNKIMRGKDIDVRDLESKHSFDSERILNTFINDPDNVKDIIGSLVKKISEDDANWNQDGKKCKIYALTILAYSTNATCRNCTRVYIDLSNDKSEGSFNDLLTKEINQIDGLFAYPHGEGKEGIRIRSLVMADYNYHEHQEFVNSNPDSVIQRGGFLDAKNSDPKTFVEIVTQKSGTHKEIHQGAVFRSGI